MKKKLVIAVSLCLALGASILFNNKIYMLYIGDCRDLWKAAQAYYDIRQYEKARELFGKIARIDTAHHAQYLTGDMFKQTARRRTRRLAPIQLKIMQGTKI